MTDFSLNKLNYLGTIWIYVKQKKPRIIDINSILCYFQINVITTTINHHIKKININNAIKFLDKN